MATRTLRQLHRKFINEAYGAWQPITPEDAKDITREDLKAAFSKMYDDLLRLAGKKKRLD
jgi:predicted Zn-dependent peptidase